MTQGEQKAAVARAAMKYVVDDAIVGVCTDLPPARRK